MDRAPVPPPSGVEQERTAPGDRIPDDVPGAGNWGDYPMFSELLCFGSLVSFTIVLTTSGSIANPVTHAAYIALTAVAALGAVFFGIKSIQEYRACRRRLRELVQE